MDINDMRVAVTIVSLVLFLGLMLHTMSRRRKAEFEAAAMLPFAEDTTTGQATGQNRGEQS